jgi:hypothetical protein
MGIQGKYSLEERKLMRQVRDMKTHIRYHSMKGHAERCLQLQERIDGILKQVRRD